MRVPDPEPEISRGVIDANCLRALRATSGVLMDLECLRWNVSVWPAEDRRPFLRRVRELERLAQELYDGIGQAMVEAGEHDHSVMELPD